MAAIKKRFNHILMRHINISFTFTCTSKPRLALDNIIWTQIEVNLPK